MSKEHWTKKLKRELAEARAETRELVVSPMSATSNMVRARILLKEDIDKMMMAGDQSASSTAIGGLFCKTMPQDPSNPLSKEPWYMRRVRNDRRNAGLDPNEE